VPNTFWSSPILTPCASVMSYRAAGSKRWRAFRRMISTCFVSSEKKRMSSLNLNRFCSTKQTGWPGSPSWAGSVNS
jgi:hypothetical protein